MLLIPHYLLHQAAVAVLAVEAQAAEAAEAAVEHSDKAVIIKQCSMISFLRQCR
jgi:hypothetical protein